MITEEMVRGIVEKHLEGTSHFLVDVSFTPGDKLVVEVDNDRAITLEELAKLNRAVREELGPIADDLEMIFSSPGMGRPFKVERQYRKHIGRVVEVSFLDGRILKGQLAGYDQETLVLRIEHPSKVKGRLPKLDPEPTSFPRADIKSVKATFKFN
jgi:ribosome maturation factor RimP